MTEYKKLIYTDVPVQEPSDHELLVKVKACSICGSDVHGFDGSTDRRIPPIIMGHEATGIIEAVGRNVSGFKPGDRITFDSTVYCGKCCYCRNGLINLCDNRMVFGVSCSDYCKHGAFAEFVTVPWRIVYRLPDNVTFEHGAMAEPLSIAVHAVKMAAPEINSHAVVVGTGMIGLLIVQLLKYTGCHVTAVDVDAGKLEISRRFGADDALNPRIDDVAAEVFELTGGKGADVSFEVVGYSDTLNTVIKCLRKGGKAVLVGNLAPVANLPLQYIVTRQISLQGSCASSGEYDTCLDLISRDAVDVKSFIGAVEPMANGQIWFDKLYNKEPGLMKVILVP